MRMNNYKASCLFELFCTAHQVTPQDNYHIQLKYIDVHLVKAAIANFTLLINMFLLYVNDMRAAVKCKLLLYADDSALIVSGEDVSVIEQTLESELVTK